MSWDEIWQTIISWVLSTGIKLVITVVLMYVLFRIINLIGRRIMKRNEKTKKFDYTTVKTTVYVGKIVAKCVVVAAAVSFLGIDTSSISALIASIGVTIGLAVNGALSNIAGGIIIAVTKPFKIDDFITVNGIDGTVTDIRLINVKLRTPDNKTVYVPNSAFPSNNIINYSESGTRRVEYKFSIAYSADFEKAREILLGIMGGNGKVLKTPEPTVNMSDHGSSSIVLTARCWVNSADYWPVYFGLIEAAKAEFDKAGVEIPFPQMDVHMK